MSANENTKNPEFTLGSHYQAILTNLIKIDKADDGESIFTVVGKENAAALAHYLRILANDLEAMQ